jgi:uncharacterized repeat protein (TIGR01451 family)
LKQLQEKAAMATTVKTDKKDYAPGQTVLITADGFWANTNIQFQVVNMGLDGLLGTMDDLVYPSWTVPNNTDTVSPFATSGTVASVKTTWLVPQSALNSTLSLTAHAITVGKDGQLGTADDVLTGESAQVTFTDSANPPVVQTFYIPETETQLRDALRAITGDSVPSGPITNYISIAVVANGTFVYYDQGENGYVADISNPTPAEIYNVGTNPGGVQIWGNSDLSDGMAPGSVSDVLSAGQVIVLQSSVPVPTPVGNISFGGGDKIGATKTIAVTRTGWSTGPDTLLAGSVEVFDTGDWGTDYRVPVGVNMSDSAQKFEYTGLFVMAKEGGATFSLDRNADGDFTDGGSNPDLQNVVLTEGQSYLVNGGVNYGARLVSNNPVQVVMLTGDIGSTYESRDSSLLPTSAWTNSYYTPVSTQNGDATQVWLYNPGTSAITVTYDSRVGSGAITSSAINVPGSANAGGYNFVELPANSGAHFHTTGANFYAFSTTDADGTSGDNQAWDWGYTLVPQGSLSSQVLIGLGLGRDPGSSTNPSENGNPVWITPVGNGETPVIIYVDYNGDNVGPNMDPNGNFYDTTLSLRELQQGKVYDPDGNQTGMLLYTLTPGVKLAAAWGQDPATASAGAPGLDVGTGVPPVQEFDAGKNGTLSLDNDNNGVISAGDELLYTIAINNISRAPVTDILLKDNLPADTTYVPNSTFFTNAANVTTQIVDDVSGTAFPLDGAGVIINPSSALPVGGTYNVTFKVLIDSFADLDPGRKEILNTGTATSGGVTVPFTDTTPLSFVSIQKEISADGINWFDEDDPDGLLITVGNTVYYRVVVTNSGGLLAIVDLQDTIVTGGGPVLNFTFGINNDQMTSVAAGTSETTNVVTTTALAGQHEDRVFATATVTDGVDTLPINVQPDDANYFGTQYGLTIVKAATVPGDADGIIDSAADDILYTVTVSNTGNQTLTNVVVTDPLAITGANPTGEIGTIASFAPGDSQSFNFTYDVTQADIDDNGGGDGDIDNTSTATSDQAGPVSDSEDVPIAQAPALTIVKAATVPGDADGIIDSAADDILYTVTVSNTGNQTLTNVVVTDPLAITGANPTGEIGTIASFAPGDSQSFNFTYDVTQADIDDNGGGDGDIDNTSTATSDQAGPVSDSEDVPIAQAPALTIVKAATVPGDADGIIDSAADDILYTVTVSNTGNQTLTNVVVTDPLAITGANPTGEIGTIASFAPGDSQSFNFTYDVTQADIDDNGGGDGDIDNTSTATSDQAGPVSDSEQVPIAQVGGLTIVKAATVPGDADGIIDSAADDILYTVTVSNTGNQTLTNVVVTDPLAITGANPTGEIGTIASFAPGDSQSFNFTYDVTQADIDDNGGGDGDIDNTSTATSDQAGPVSDSEDVPIAQAPALTIVKAATVPGDADGIIDSAADDILYTVTVSNTGNQTLTNVVVTDPLAITGANPTGEIGTIASFAPGDSQSFNFTYDVTQADIDDNGGGDGDIDNTSTATSDQAGPVSDSEDVPIAQAPALTIVKAATVPGDADGIIDSAADDILYTVTVSNTGNQTLTNVVVTDPLAITGANPTGEIGTIASFAPGDSQSFNFTYDVTQADIDDNGGGDGDIDNTSTATSDQAGPVSDSEDVPIAQAPALTIVKAATVPGDADGIIDSAADDILYTVTVSNTGNQTLTNVVVTDPLAITGANPTGEIGTIASFAPGDSQSFNFTYDVTQADIDDNGGGDGDIDNTSTATSDQAGPVSDSEDVPIAQAPALTIVKAATVPGDADGIIDSAADDILYTVTVSNTGNQTLTNVVVTDPLAITGANPTGEIGTIASFAPGDSQSFNFTYDVTQADIDDNGGGDGDIDNTSTATSDQAGPVSDSEDVPIAQAPALTIVKAATVPGDADGIIDSAADDILYTVTVSNTGNQTLTNVVVTDPLAITGANPTGEIGTIASFAPGDSQSFNFTYDVTQADIDDNGGGDGDIDNTSTATSDQAGPVSDSEDVPIAQAPALTIVKAATVPGDADGIIDSAADDILYTVTVSNTGNQTLTNVVVTDPLAITGANPTGEIGTIASFAPGDSQSFNFTYDVTQADIDDNGGGDGDIDNTSTATSDQAGPVSDSAEVPLVQTGSIGDRVWEDMNYNGIQDPGEPGLANFVVSLLDASGNPTGLSMNTDANGNYLFSNLAAGDYRIQVLAQPGYYYTKPNVGPDALDSDVDSSGVTSIINLSPGESELDWDAGLYLKATLGDRVWLDRDKDGIQDANEAGVGHVGVTLLDAGGGVLATTTTDVFGNYLFSNLDPGTYGLEFNKAAAATGAISVAKYPWTQQNAGGNPNLDSDVKVDPGNPNLAFTTAPIVLTSGENDLSWDAGITPIVIDLNGDGIHTISRADSQGTFDLLGTGVGIKSGWLSGEDGFLVIDGNANDRIDDISEMFGGSQKGDGFAKLASFDSNRDGVVDASDADFASLKVWQDANGNHQTDVGELISLADAGVVSLSLDFTELPFRDAQDNLHLERSSAILSDGAVVDMTDVYLNVSAFDAAAAGVSLPSLGELMSSDNSLDGLWSNPELDWVLQEDQPLETTSSDAFGGTPMDYSVDASAAADLNTLEVQPQFACCDLF